ncbi:MAG: hypothetical protein K9M75_04280 [Phycisphaerae bacterium]|nr:hypothetical protein [Phycisphaerae bacterium]
MLKKRFVFLAACLLFVFALFVSPVFAEANKMYKGNVGGYFHAGKDKIDDSYNAGYSMYSAVWPLLEEYPGRSFQSGLFGTWMGPDHGKPAPDGMRLYTKIEGGLGWWRATEFPTTTPKFIMGGVELNFRSWANGPGSGKGQDWDNPKGHYGVAQLSPWVLFPPDGLNLKQGTCGELFGYGYLPLPLTEKKAKTNGKDIPTGNHCWTLFLSTGNFKGPVAFFTPHFWSRVTVEDPRLAGMFFDSRPCKANKPISMETQHIHCGQVTDSNGDTYVRVTKTQFPVGANGETVILHRLTAYDKSALWDGVKAWFEGGKPVDGSIDPKGACVNKFNGQGGPGWRVFGSHIPKDEQVSFDMDFMGTKAPDPYTFGLKWDMGKVTKRKTENGSLVTIPEYYKQTKEVKKIRGKDIEVKKWVAVDAKDVPAETGLAELSFKRPKNDRPSRSRVTPDGAETCWKKPGPAAGPFKVKIGDGSTVTYYWYRFADQPALLNADMTDKERENIQARVEKLHRNWTKDRDYLAPPTVGKLADIDPALIVTPPKGMEAGYVPIVTSQKFEAKN